MFSFHKPKIYRSNLGCCICRAKSSSSRFTDSKKYESEFEKCFLVEHRSGEICNACVLLVKRWKKLPTGTNRHWNHVVDARAGPGTKSMKKTKELEHFPKKKFPKSRLPDLKSRMQSMSSSESDDDDDVDDDADMSDDDSNDKLDQESEISENNDSSYNQDSNESGSGSLRRSTRLRKHVDDDSQSVIVNSTIVAEKRAIDKKRQLMRDQFFSYLDTSFWQREKICCGFIYKGPNNQVMICPELLNPCDCRRRLSKPPELVAATTTFAPPKLQHQDSFSHSESSSDYGSSGINEDNASDDHSSGVCSMIISDDNLEISDRLSNTSMDVIDDGQSSSASSVAFSEDIVTNKSDIPVMALAI